MALAQRGVANKPMAPVVVSLPNESKTRSIVQAQAQNRKSADTSILHLHSSWSLYFHDAREKDWTTKGYIKLCTVASAEEYWCMIHHTPARNFYAGMFFLMRENITPCWEDPLNRGGGYWSATVPFDRAFDAWTSLTSKQVRESLFAPNDTLTITSVSMRPKREFSIVQVWNNEAGLAIGTAGRRFIEQLADTLDLPYSAVQYTPFSNKHYF